jgi:hypothetical protein
MSAMRKDTSKGLSVGSVSIRETDDYFLYIVPPNMKRPSVVVYWKHAGLIQLWRYPE